MQGSPLWKLPSPEARGHKLSRSAVEVLGSGGSLRSQAHNAAQPQKEARTPTRHQEPPRPAFVLLRSPLDTRSPQVKDTIPELEEEETQSNPRKELSEPLRTIRSDGWESNAEAIRLKSEIEVLQITIKHMQEELKVEGW